MTTSMAMSNQDNLAVLPDELLANILLTANVQTFLQLIQSSRRIYDVARASRHVILHHLQLVPGNKIRISDPSLSNDELFLLLRQRLSKNLYGVNFTADCSEWISRNAPINTAACAIEGFDSDYFRMSLVFKGSPSIRHYTTCCSLKERIDDMLGPAANIMFLHQRKALVAVLCSWNIEDLEELDSESDSDVEKKVPWTNSKDMLQLWAARNPTSSLEILPMKKMKVKSPQTKIYRVLCFDVFSRDHPSCYIIEQHKKLVPKHFTTGHRTLFAILWDRGDSKHSTKNAEVVKYSVKGYRTSRDAPHTPETKVIWPKTEPSRQRRDSESGEDAHPKRFPHKIAFFKDGRRLKMWSEGDLIPSQVIDTEPADRTYRYVPTNKIGYEDFSVMVDLPFYGFHRTVPDDTPGRSICHKTHLCLGIATSDLDSDKEEKALYIMRSKSRLSARDCDHSVNMQRLSHISAQNTKAVARLWGWRELDTNLTGLETVAISTGGTRIAIALWNKVLVYSLDPSILCEDLLEDEDAEDSGKKKRRRPKKTCKTRADGFYLRQMDELVEWKVADLHPVLLDLKGAVVHKMSWTPVKRNVGNEDIACGPTLDEDEDKQLEKSEDNPDHSSTEAPETSLAVPSDKDICSTLQPIVKSEDATSQPSNLAIQQIVSDSIKSEQSEGQKELNCVMSSKSNVANELSVASNSQTKTQSIVKTPVISSTLPFETPTVAPAIQLDISLQKTSPRKKEKVSDVSAYNTQGVVLSEKLSLADGSSHVPKDFSNTLPVEPTSSLDPILITLEDVQKAEPSGIDSMNLGSMAMDDMPDSNSTITEQQTADDHNVGESISKPAISFPESSGDTTPFKAHYRKRITENELLILTDRGIQVWNIRSSGRGKMITRELRTEESLKDKIPVRGS